MIGRRGIDACAGGEFPTYPAAIGIETSDLVFVHERHKHRFANNCWRRDLSSHMALPQRFQSIGDSRDRGSIAPIIIAKGRPVFRRGCRSGTCRVIRWAFLKPLRHGLRGFGFAAIGGSQGIHAVELLFDIALARVGRCVLQAVGWHHAEMARTTNPIVDRMGSVFQVDEFGASSACENVALRGLVAIAAMMVVGLEDDSQVDFLPTSLS